jgi:hypothetical protein
MTEGNCLALIYDDQGGLRAFGHAMTEGNCVTKCLEPTTDTIINRK